MVLRGGTICVDTVALCSENPPARGHARLSWRGTATPVMQERSLEDSWPKQWQFVQFLATSGSILLTICTISRGFIQLIFNVFMYVYIHTGTHVYTLYMYMYTHVCIYIYLYTHTSVCLSDEILCNDINSDKRKKNLNCCVKSDTTAH